MTHLVTFQTSKRIFLRIPITYLTIDLGKQTAKMEKDSYHVLIVERSLLLKDLEDIKPKLTQE